MEVDKDIKTEQNIENECKIENNQNTSVQDNNKFLTFIKSNTLLSILIAFGIISVITLAIVLPIVLTKENDKNSNNQILNDLPIVTDSPIINDDDDIILDFSSIKNSDKILSKYATITSTVSSDLDTFCTLLNGQSSDLDDKEKVYIIYKWIAENINYDFNNADANTQPENVYISKLTVSSGYSKLFARLLICMDFPEENIKSIEGYTKEMGYNIENELTEGAINHEWNAVEIEGNLCLIDTSLGAGCKENSDPKTYTEYYLCTPPKQLVRTHLPKKEQEEFQNLRNPINFSTFKNLAFTNHYFFENGFVSIQQDKAIQNICGEGKITLIYNTATRPSLLITMKKNDDDTNDYVNWIMNKKIDNGYEINLNINEGGNYDLGINVKINNDINYNIANFKIQCNSPPATIQYFPEFTPEYISDDEIQLVSPLEDPLVQGLKYDFKIYYTNSDKLYLLLSTATASEIISMDKDNDGYFIEKDVMIHGEFVEICLIASNHLPQAFVRYSTIGDLIEFPETSITPFKKRLESPLKENLVKGEIYDFRIICDKGYIIKILCNTDEIVDAFSIEENERENIYTATLQIQDNCNVIDITYDNEGYPESMYVFPVISLP